MNNQNNGSNINPIGLLQTFAVIIFIGIAIGNLGLVPLWLTELVGNQAAPFWIPEQLVSASVFLFFLCLIMIFTLVMQAVLIKDLQND